MLTGLPMVSCKDVVCFSCVLKKHHRDSFDKHASWHASVPLELVHSDLCDPLPFASFSGFKYFLTFIDDYSRRTWVYFLKLKSKVFNMFLAYKTLVENNMVIEFLSCDIIMRQNMSTTSSLPSTLNTESNNNTLFHIHHN